MSRADREVAQLERRLDMMVARGVLAGTTDSAGIQTMQASLLRGETADGLQRFQSYGVSSMPPPGSDVLAVFISGNRDHGVIVAVNDRATRPKGLRQGETVLYSSSDCTVLLNADNDVLIRARRVIIEAEETVEIDAPQQVTIRTPLLRVEGSITASGTITEGVP